MGFEKWRIACSVVLHSYPPWLVYIIYLIRIYPSRRGYTEWIRVFALSRGIFPMSH
jgi:hypothetical protein